MRKFAFLPFLMLALFLAGCDKTEVDNNPLPIIWGEISFFPKTVERNSRMQVWKNVSFAGYGNSGTIETVTIKPEETIIENLVSGNLKVQKQIYRNVGGEIERAFVFTMSGGFDEIGDSPDLSRLPAFKIGSCEITGIDGGDSSDSSETVHVARLSSANISFQSVGKTVIDDIAWTEAGQNVAIKQVSLDEIFIPDNVRNNGDKMIIANYMLTGLKSSFAAISVGQATFNLKDGAFRMAIDDASFAGALLREFDIPNPPETIKFAFNGDGNVKGHMLTAKAALDVKDLFDAQAGITGKIAASRFDALEFSLTDKGAIKHLSNETKQGLAIMAMFIPEFGQSLAQFLAVPGQTISGMINLLPGQEDVSVKVIQPR